MWTGKLRKHVPTPFPLSTYTPPIPSHLLFFQSVPPSLLFFIFTRHACTLTHTHTDMHTRWLMPSPSFCCILCFLSSRCTTQTFVCLSSQRGVLWNRFCTAPAYAIPAALPASHFTACDFVCSPPVLFLMALISSHVSLQSLERGRGEEKRNGVWGRGDEVTADKMWWGWSEIEMQSCKSRGRALTREWGRGDWEEDSSWERERIAGKGKKQGRLMQHKLEIHIYLLLELLFKNKRNPICTLLSSIVFAASSWILFSALLGFLLVCQAKLIFPPPTPAETFFLCNKFPHRPYVYLLKLLLAETKLSDREKA